MKKSLYILFVLLLLAGSFLAGSWYSQRQPSNDAPGARRVLYYVDPMNPAHTSDKAGLAPCGMEMEPVYADGETPGQAGAGGSTSIPLGTVRISPEKQQIIGVRVGEVEKGPGTHTLRTLGRVAVDETRFFRLIAATDGWTKEIFPHSTGTLVMKDQPLISFYSKGLLTAQQQYFVGLNTMDRHKRSNASAEQLALTGDQIRLAEENLQSLGIGDLQIQEIARTRKASTDIVLRAPVTGFVLARNVFLGQRFERGTEFFRLVDPSRVWILADVFENEAQYIRPSSDARVYLPYAKKVFRAKVSDTLPLFDASTRTLKVRLEVDNLDFALRPDMFVDVEFPVKLPPALTVHVDSILDSGLRKTVFVDRGNGFFEPRQVETGWRMGDRVEIVKGLMPGERIVISGTFLLDSESRMKMAAAGMSKKAEARSAKDPVCGMDVDEGKAKAAGRISENGGKTYYFCADQCKQQFDRDHKFRLNVDKPAETVKPSITLIAQTEQRAKDPICGMFVAPGVAAKAGRVSEFHGKTYYFCADECKQQFDQDPKRYVEKINGDGKPGGTPGIRTEQQAKDPVCGKMVVVSVAARAPTMSEYHGKTYYFCCPHCKASFDKKPETYVQ